MKALSLTQPWATLIALGEKKFETRSWACNYRGPLAIHASKNYPRWAKDLEETELFKSSLRSVNGIVTGQYSYPVCVTSVIGCYPTHTWKENCDAKEIAFGDWSDNRWAWRLGPIEKIFGMAEFPVKGHLGLWDWKP